MKRMIISFLLVFFPAVALAENGQLGCIPGTSNPARGIVSGCTYFDLQKYGSMGRQIVFNETFIEPQIVCTHQSSDAADGGRNVRYNAFCFGFCSPPSLIESGWNVGAGEILPDRAGFPTVAILEDATTVIAQHWNAQYPAGEFNALTYKNNTIGLPDYSGEWVPDSSWSGYSSGGPQETFVWPQIGITDNGGSQVSHLLLSQWRSFDETEDTLNTIVYLRRLGATGSAWQTGLEIGQSRHYRSAVVVAERNSDNVLIAWVGPRGDGTIGGAPLPRFFGDGSGADAFDTDVYAMFSSDAGATWSSRMNLTLRADSLPGGWAPYHKISALWDGGGTAHIVWQATSWAGYGGVFTRQARMFHWDNVSGAAHVAADGAWLPELCSGGEYQLSIDNPQLSWCDNKLYLTYTAFAPPERADDCAHRAFDGDGFGAANGDLYLVVSNDGGAHWDNPRNLTDSYTPDCDAVGDATYPDCANDVWQSVTRYGLDISGTNWGPIPDLSANLGGYAGSHLLSVLYVDDSDPGAAILAEGGWTNSPLRVFSFGCVEPVAGAVLASSLPQLIPSVDTLEISGADSALVWILENTGAADITDLSVTLNSVNPPGHVTLSGFGTTLSAGSNNADTGVITLNAIQETELLGAAAEIVVDGSFPGAPRSFAISYSVPTPPPPPCCAVPGDFDHSGSFNIADVTSGIGYIFSGGPGPVCCEEADFNADGSFNISDVTFGIAYIFIGDFPPPCPPQGSVCGL